MSNKADILAMDAAGRDAVVRAAGLVSQAIVALASLGGEAPASVREALGPLGSAYSSLGYADPDLPYRLPREGEGAVR